jgi:hypothetical protein
MISLLQRLNMTNEDIMRGVVDTVVAGSGVLTAAAIWLQWMQGVIGVLVGIGTLVLIVIRIRIVLRQGKDDDLV